MTLNTFQIILVFKRVLRSCFAFGLAVDHAAFQIKDEAKIQFFFILTGVFHQHDVHILNILGVYCINTKNFGEQTVFVALEMFTKRRQPLQVHIKLTVVHCFDDKFVVMAEEKKAARSSCSLSSLKNALTVVLRVKTGMEVSQLSLEQPPKHVFERFNSV